MKLLSRLKTLRSLLAYVGRDYPYFVVPLALVLLAAIGLLLATGGASFLAPFFYAIF